MRAAPGWRSWPRPGTTGRHRLRLPVGLERLDAAQRVVEIAAETDCAIVHEHVRRGLAPGHGGDVPKKSVLSQPAPHVRLITGCEHHDVEATVRQRLQELGGTRTGWIPMLRILP